MYLQVEAEVYAVSGVRRSPSELKKKWSQIKTATKGRVASVSKEQRVTGGGPKLEPDLSEHESRVVSIMGSVCTHGLASGVDTCDSFLQTASGMFC